MTTGSTTQPLRKTALNAAHRALRAKMVDFGGWEMPVEYSGLIAEHIAVRTGVGLFDVSHMGDIQLRGPGSLAAVQRLCMNDASKLAVGQAQYSAMLAPDGTFVDDVVVHKLSDNDYLIVINAGTREKDVAWVRRQIGHMPSIHIGDYSDMYTQLAVQGPKAEATLQKLTDTDLSGTRNYWFTWGKLNLKDGGSLYNVMIARTGYTGEDGFEIYIPSDAPTSERVWGEVLNAGAEFDILPCGLGARNTLRLEAAMPLYGHEISETVNVFEAGLERYAEIDLAAKGDFVGRDALVAIEAAGGPKRRLVGLEMVERGIARDGYPVCTLGGEKIGAVTSGSPAPFLKKNIALAYVPVQYAGVGEEVAVEIRGQLVQARVVALPFYKRTRKYA